MNLLLHPLFIVSLILCLVWIYYEYVDKQKQTIYFLKSTQKFNCVKKLPCTKYENPNICDIDPLTPRSENSFANAEKSFGPDAFLDGAHYEYLPGESRSDYHQRWRERVRDELVFHPGDPNYC